MTESAVPQQRTSGRRTELSVDGMSCGACARRVENALNKLDGIRATVKFSTRTAIVDSDSDVAVDTLCRAIEDAGYHAELRVGQLAGVDEWSAEPRQGPIQRLVPAVLRRMTFGHLGG